MASTLQIVQCTKTTSHEWSNCPFAHPGERAARRDPRIYLYTGIVCPDMKKVSLPGHFALHCPSYQQNPVC